MSKFRMMVVAVAMMGVALLFGSSNAYAVASFTRQTGLACSACHTTFPELTPMGRDFKLNGYTLNGYTTTTDKTVTEEGTNKNAPLTLLKDLPLSINVRSSLTNVELRQPGTQNPSIEVPQQVNFWFAGQITRHFGTYIQMTYSENGSPDHFTFDNSDARYAKKTTLAGKDLVWGIDINNNPTFEDLWNSTPGYGFPYASPDSAGFTPTVATLIDGTLGRTVIGGGPYAMWNNHLYGLVEIYRTQHIGTPQPETGAGQNINIASVAPYWRLAWQQDIGKNNYLEIGTYGIYLKSHPFAISGPTTDNYTDLAADASYQYNLDNGDLIVLHSTYIYEKNDLNASVASALAAQAHHNLRTFRLDANYHFGNRYTLTAGPFITTGTSDSLLHTPGVPLTGFANGSPDNEGYIFQAAYWPWQNIEIGLQYRVFSKFNGAHSNYDGAGRDASDNNTLYAFVWISL